MPFDYNGKVVLITGAGSGFGELAARKFSEAGARLLIADINEDALDTLATELRDGGAKVTAVACDVSKEEEVRAAVKGAVDAYGTLDVAINNAGVTHPISRLADLPVSEVDRQYAVNIRGVFLCMKYEIPQMLEQGGGVILNMSSVAGLVGAQGLGAYSMAKHAVIGLTKSAAVEYAAKGIRINALCPAAIDSPMMRQTTEGTNATLDTLATGIPMKRVGEIREVVDAMLWLCSDENSFMTGHAVALDGGFTAL
ncbi:MAG: glucose 1-dehydrogenase [Candidatus Hydrogenedentes bacterium]|nr:glucose 1-dehydrogenase [Candidatus Hydrogenedentota bacterium]